MSLHVADHSYVDQDCSVSVIIPVFNMETTLAETLESALRNTEALGNGEILVIDDGSTDGSLALASGYAERFSKVRVHTRPHLGSGAARNFGLSAARGEYISFLDADDFYPEDTTLLKLYQTAKEKNVAICGGTLAICYGEEPWKTEYDFPYDGNAFPADGYVDYADYQYDFAYYRFLYRRELLQGMRFPDLLRFQDVPFFVMAMIKAGRFYALKETTYVYRQGHNAVEWTNRKAQDLLLGFRGLLSLAKKMGYHRLYHTAYLQYLDYERQEVFLRGMKNGEHPHKVVFSWLKLLYSLDWEILSACGVAEGGESIGKMLEKVSLSMDPEEILCRIRKDQHIAKDEEKRKWEALEEDPAAEAEILSEAERLVARQQREEIARKQDAIGCLLVQGMGNKKLAHMLRNERDSFRWLSYLKYVATRYLVVLVVKDTPGNNMPLPSVKNIREAGFDQFSTELWRTYIGIMHRGKMLFQGFHENEEPTEYAYETLEGDLRIHAVSQAWRRGNRGDIFINGRQCSAESRGVNIVVYDTEKKRLVDSIGFDAHEEGRIWFSHLELS